MTAPALDNGGIESHGPLGGFEPRETLLMALRVDDDGPESEPVVISLDEGCAVLDLDDGQRIEFDLEELRAALADHHTIRCEVCGRVGMDREPACDHFAAWWVTARGWGGWRPWRQT